MKDINKDISKLQAMRTDLYQICSNIAAMNEICKSYQNDNRVYLWKGEFHEVTEDGISTKCLELYILAKTKGEAEIRLKARVDEEYDDYEFMIFKVKEDEDGIIKDLD